MSSGIRHRFLLGLAALAALFAAVSGTPAPAGAGSAFCRAAIDPDTDITWRGMFRVPRAGSSAGDGTTAGAGCATALRYLDGKRCVLFPLFKTGQRLNAGDLVAYEVPSAGHYTGADPMRATALTELRRWKNWNLVMETPAWVADVSGTRIGGLWWEEGRSLLWYTAHGYYFGQNMPVLGATVLNADGTVGARYGPWWYQSTQTGAGSPLHWKKLWHSVQPVPLYARKALGGRKMLMGGMVGSVATSGHIGPGLTAFDDFPPLADPPDTALAAGFPLADYNKSDANAAGLAEWRCRLPFATRAVSAGGGLGIGPGGWHMSLDQVNGLCWVDTGEKHGVVMVGRRCEGDVWYGDNPLPHDKVNPAYYADEPFVDPTRPNPEAQHGYGARGWYGLLATFDPDHLAEVAAGTRSPLSNGMAPARLSDWSARWPNIPWHSNGKADPAAGKPVTERPTTSQCSNSLVWDAASGELIWVQAASCDPSGGTYCPTVQVFSVN